MVEWCVKERIIDRSDTIEDFHRLLHQESWVQVGYKLEEYLAEKSQQQRCLKEVLQDQVQISEAHKLLVQIPFRGYITTTYDTFIEAAYSEVKQSDLTKFYRSSIQNAVEACQNNRPFILKLHGDIDSPNSITLGHRILKGLPIADYQNQLQQLLSGFSTLFIGFERGDPDLEILKDFIKKENVVHRPNLCWIVFPLEQLSESEVEDLWDNKRIGVISCKADDVQSELVELLKTLDTQIAVAQPSLQDTKVVPAPKEETGVGVKDVEEQQTPQLQTSPIAELGRQITIFIAYAREDIELLMRVELELTTLQFQLQKELIKITWDKSEITESVEWEIDIKDPLNAYPLVLLLVSPNFVGSKYCYSEQMKRAVKRHENGAWICPILLRPCRWERTPFGELPVLPVGGLAVTRWPNQDDAFLNISHGIERAVRYLKARPIS